MLTWSVKSRRYTSSWLEAVASSWWYWHHQIHELLVPSIFTLHNFSSLLIVTQKNYDRDYYHFRFLFNRPIFLEITPRHEKEPNPARTNQTRTQVLLRTKPNPNPKVKIVQDPKPNWTLPYNEPNRTQTQMSWFLLGSFTEWNCRYIHPFHSKRDIILYLG